MLFPLQFFTQDAGTGRAHALGVSADSLPACFTVCVTAGMNDGASYAYTDAYDTAQKHSLMLRRANGRYQVIYASGAEPYKDADRYVQSLLDDNALHGKLAGAV